MVALQAVQIFVICVLGAAAASIVWHSGLGMAYVIDTAPMHTGIGSVPVLWHPPYLAVMPATGARSFALWQVRIVMLAPDRIA